MTKKQPKLFDFIRQISSKSRKYNYDKKIAPAYIMTLWLSHDKDLIHKVNKMNQYQFALSDEAVYEYYMDVIPHSKRYIKWTKKREDEKMEKAIEIIKKKYPRLSTKEALRIVSFVKNRRNK